MRRIALTGGIGTGKSYVLKRFREKGVPVVDADTLAREAVAPGSEGFNAVVKRFGADILTPDGEIDRGRLGAIVFADKDARRDLEAIVHPIVRKAIDEFFRQVPPDIDIAIADVPLLYETGRQRQFDEVIVVAAPRETQVQRVMTRDRLSREEAERRLAAQLPIDAKVTLADHVIRTSGTHAETDAQVDTLLEELRTRN